VARRRLLLMSILTVLFLLHYPDIDAQQCRTFQQGRTDACDMRVYSESCSLSADCTLLYCCSVTEIWVLKEAPAGGCFVFCAAILDRWCSGCCFY